MDLLDENLKASYSAPLITIHAKFHKLIQNWLVRVFWRAIWHYSANDRSEGLLVRAKPETERGSTPPLNTRHFTNIFVKRSSKKNREGDAAFLLWNGSLPALARREWELKSENIVKKRPGKGMCYGKITKRGFYCHLMKYLAGTNLNLTWTFHSHQELCFLFCFRSAVSD